MRQNLEFSKSLLTLIFSGLLPISIPMLDQFFIARLSSPLLLNAYSLVAISTSIFALFSKSIGQTFLSQIGKIENEKKFDFLKTFFGISFLSATVLTGALFVSIDYQMHFYEINSSKSTITKFYYLIIASSFFAFISVPLTYTLLANKENLKILKANTFIALANLAGNLASNWCTDSSEWRYLGYGISSLACTFFGFFYLCHLNKISFIFLISKWHIFSSQSLNMVGWQIVANGSLFVWTWLVAILLQKFGYASDVSILNASCVLIQFLSIPTFAVMGIGAVHIGSARRESLASEGKEIVKKIKHMAIYLTIVPTLIFMLGANVYLKFFLNIVDNELLYLAFIGLLLRSVFIGLTASDITLLRVEGKQQIMAFLDIIFLSLNYFALLILIFLGSSFGKSIFIIHFITLGLHALILRRFVNKSTSNVSILHLIDQRSKA